MGFGKPEGEEKAAQAHQQRITFCKSAVCGAKIIWLKTHTGGNIPTDEATVEAGQTDFRWGTDVCHFKTCKDPGVWRGRQP